ncbi:hypothetical protein VMCG_00788 [Cytospora schulzeri]|uniref:Uncharacterized protein n=1 Tax=Cytospora schulzeri TaxID=448051 RepID=A0A423XA89_9PEZI|nr:hypothetical protein VMCG_00788 [Valsa malicola]
MPEAASERESLLARHKEVKSALLCQLDLAEVSLQYQHSLRQAVRDWNAIAKDPKLPARGEIPTVVNVLRRIARNEDIEVFLTVLAGEEIRLVHMEDRHGNDIHECFASDKQDILQVFVAYLKGGLHAEAQLPSVRNQL